jgi:CRISPR/Cas system-associated protein Csx1
MRLSKETFNILKNFSSINSNILIKPGNVLKTRSAGSNIYVKAKVQEDFDTEVAIWDLNKFLGVISMFNNPDLEFHDTHVDISNGRSSVKYYYAEKSLLTVPTKDINMPDVLFTFTLDEQDLNEIMKAASILQVNDLKIIAGDGKIRLTVDDSSNSTSDSFEIIVEENYDGPNYEGQITIGEIKFLSGSYNVDVTDTVVSRFTHTSQDITYFIAINKG